MAGADPALSRRGFAALVIAEAVVLAIGAAAMIFYDLGVAGAVGMAVLVAAFTYTLFRAGERRAIAAGNFSPAMGRYNRRMLTAGAIYVLGLFTAIWVHDELQPNGPAAFAVAFLPSIGVLWMVWAMGRLLAEETDEYLRHRMVRASLFGLGTLLTLATVWGFFEQFDLVPHVPAWAAVPIFALGLGFANCTRWGRM
ncbi:MAG TPA: hypothetical protein VJ763_09690 [Sphingomicrobium sp.]|nr:hypothetical protein [Sphingomicrobium sp.]